MEWPGDGSPLTGTGFTVIGCAVAGVSQNCAAIGSVIDFTTGPFLADSSGVIFEAGGSISMVGGVTAQGVFVPEDAGYEPAPSVVYFPGFLATGSMAWNEFLWGSASGATFNIGVVDGQAMMQIDTPTPEPVSLALVGVGLCAIGLGRRVFRARGSRAAR